MSGSPQNSSTDAERREAAFNWLQCLPEETISEEDFQAWLRWYSSSEDNRLAFDAAQSFYLRLRNMSGRQRVMLRGALSPARAAAPARKTALFTLAACVLAAIVLGLWSVMEPTFRTHIYSAPVDRYRTVRLPDGSAMTLSARAVASVSYAAKSRLLDVLQGAVYFEVRRDAKRPFIVRAGEINVTAVGTAFSVARDPLGLNVTVTQGSVDVVRTTAPANQRNPTNPPALPDSTSPRRLRVSAGERTRLAINEVAAVAQDSPEDIGHAWASPSMQFFNAPLGDVIKAVNVYAHTRIRIEDPRVTTLNYSGTVFRQRIGEWIAALPKVYPVRNIELDDGTSTIVLNSAGAAEN